MLGSSEVSHKVSHEAAATRGLTGAGRPKQDTHASLADSRPAGRALVPLHQPLQQASSAYPWRQLSQRAREGAPGLMWPVLRIPRAPFPPHCRGQRKRQGRPGYMGQGRRPPPTRRRHKISVVRLPLQNLVCSKKKKETYGSSPILNNFIFILEISQILNN